jgi:hypothetical protein
MISFVREQQMQAQDGCSCNTRHVYLREQHSLLSRDDKLFPGSTFLDPICMKTSKLIGLYGYNQCAEF